MGKEKGTEEFIPVFDGGGYVSLSIIIISWSIFIG